MCYMESCELQARGIEQGSPHQSAELEGTFNLAQAAHCNLAASVRSHLARGARAGRGSSRLRGWRAAPKRRLPTAPPRRRACPAIRPE